MVRTRGGGSVSAEVARPQTCATPVGCTTECLFTGRPCTRFGVTFTSLLRVEHWFGQVRRTMTLWRAVDGAWQEVASSRSARVLADRFTRGPHVVMPAGVVPPVPAPLERAQGAPAGTLF